MVELKDRYDVVVISAGMGGLTCGGLLAKQGKGVLICEQHVSPGGCVAAFNGKVLLLRYPFPYLPACPGETLLSALEAYFDKFEETTVTSLKAAD